jgi:hypothetical protein
MTMSDLSSQLASLQERVSLSEQEGAMEAFCDVIRDTGVTEAKQGDTLTYGTYTNTFTVTEVVRQADPSDALVENEIRTIKCEFYEDAQPYELKVYKTYVEGEENDCVIYWFDGEGNTLPDEASNWNDILENMDIFIDEL